MYQRIAVPIDGSPTSALGLQEAVKIAKSQGARLRLIHVLEDLPPADPYSGIIAGEPTLSRLREVGASILRSSAAGPREAGVVVECELIEQTGCPAAKLILQSVTAHGDELIVCGTHGRTGLARLTLGSTAEDILRNSSVPVLLVPRGVVERTMRGADFAAGAKSHAPG